MWTCTNCGRSFDKEKQMHSCRRVPTQQHFAGKDKARELFDYLCEQVNDRVGKCKIISLPCCIHLFGIYDFLAALPKKDKLEIRFALDRKINSPRLKVSVPMSAHVIKNCFDISSKEEINGELIDWLNQSYHFKDQPGYCH